MLPFTFVDEFITLYAVTLITYFDLLLPAGSIVHTVTAVTVFPVAPILYLASVWPNPHGQITQMPVQNQHSMNLSIRSMFHSSFFHSWLLSCQCHHAAISMTPISYKLRQVLNAAAAYLYVVSAWWVAKIYWSLTTLLAQCSELIDCTREETPSRIFTIIWPDTLKLQSGDRGFDVWVCKNSAVCMQDIKNIFSQR